MTEGEPQVSTKDRLDAFKQDWFKKHPQNLEIIDNFKPVIQSFISNITPELTDIETDLKKMIMVVSSDQNSPGYYSEAAERLQKSGAFATADPKKLQPLGLDQVGVFVDEQNSAEATFGFVVFHEFSHILIMKEAERTHLLHIPEYQYLEEGFVSWMAIGALTNIGNNHGRPNLPHQAPFDAPQAVFSAFLDRFANTATQVGKTPRYKTYKKVIEKAVVPLIFSRDLSYVQRLTNKAFAEEEQIQLFDLLKETSDQYENNSEELNITALKLYNLLSGNNFDTWREWDKLHKNKPVYKAVYWPPYTTMFEQ